MWAKTVHGQWRYWLCTQTLSVFACAHWQNMAQRDLIVVIVIVVVVVVSCSASKNFKISGEQSNWELFSWDPIL